MQPNPESAHFTPLSSSLNDSKVQRENNSNFSPFVSQFNNCQSGPESISKWIQRPLERPPNKASRLFDLPHAPTYYPNEEEFKDPAAYVASIRREAEKFGICKIVPPPNFNPKFALNVQDFVFKSRKQQPSATGASTRTNLNFIENLKAFHNQTNDSFKVPNISGQQVDLYQLYLETKQRGGYSKVSKDKAWAEIGSSLSLPQSKTGSNIKAVFDKYILPYEEYINSDKVPRIRQRKKTKISTSEAVEYDSDDCGVCHTSQSLETLIVCEICEVAFHLHCLDPPLKKIPKVDFFCASCLKNRESGSGFEDGGEYTLAQFGAKAENFKQTYLDKILSRDTKVARLPLASMSTEDIENMVEKEFWNLVGDPLNDTTVEYGADLPGNFHGSGFASPEKHPDDPFSKNSWNLNILPMLSSSLFSYHKEGIYGMTVPWLYIGMCFSMFCWHTEDHYAYSFNYQHWGDTKTWYGIPAAHAESFEVAFRKEAPELFKKHPDLLSHLTTILSPKDLLCHNVPVYVIDQRAGEFVLTFPRAYHAGFNHGFNFNEAVNFAPSDWLPFGLDCLARYRQLRKSPVFSHHGLLLRAATTTQDPNLAQQLSAPLESMRSTELEIRNRVARFTNRRAFRPLSSERTSELPHCRFCQAICYFSVIGCSCDENKKKVACLDHAAELCECPLSERILYEHITMEVFDAAFLQLEEVANPLSGWLQRYQNALQNQSNPKKATLEQLVEDACTQLHEPPEEAAQLSVFLNSANRWREQVVKLLEAYSNKDGAEFIAPRDLCNHVQELADQATAMAMDEDVDAFKYLARFVSGFCSAVRSLQSNPSATLLQAFDLQNQAALLGLRLEEANIIDDLVVQLKWCEEARDALKSQTPSKCLTILSKKPKNPACQAITLIEQLRSNSTVEDSLVRTVQDLLEQSKSPNFRKRPLTARIYPVISRIEAKPEKDPISLQLIASNREVEAWSSRIQELFNHHFGSRRSLVAKLTTLHKQSQEYSPLDGIRSCICNGKDSTNTIICQTCKVTYHIPCLRIDTAVKGFICPVCDTTKYRPIQVPRIKFSELQELCESGKKLPFIPPELNIVNDLIEQLQIISKKVFSSIKSGAKVDFYKGLFRLLEGLFVSLEEETHTLRNLIVNQSKSRSAQNNSSHGTPLPPASSLLKVAAEHPSNQKQAKNATVPPPLITPNKSISNHRSPIPPPPDHGKYFTGSSQSSNMPGVARIIGTNIPINAAHNISNNPSPALSSNINREPLTNSLPPRSTAKPQPNSFNPNANHLSISAALTPPGTGPANGHSERFQRPDPPSTPNPARSSNPFSIESLLGNSSSEQRAPEQSPNEAYQRPAYSSSYSSHPYSRSSTIGPNYLPPGYNSRAQSIVPDTGLRRPSYHREHGIDESSRMNQSHEIDYLYTRSNRVPDPRLTSYPLEAAHTRHMTPNVYRPAPHQSSRQVYHQNLPHNHQAQPPYSSSHHIQLPHQPPEQPHQGFYSSNPVTPLASHPSHNNGLIQSNIYNQNYQPQRSGPMDPQSSHGRNPQTIIASHLQPSQPPGP